MSGGDRVQIVSPTELVGPHSDSTLSSEYIRPDGLDGVYELERPRTMAVAS